jgi:hypothetical protein
MMYFVIYLVGVAIGLAVMRDRWSSRVVTALAWPLGPIAFLVVVPILLLAAMILWPFVMLPAAVLIALLIWLTQ